MYIRIELEDSAAHASRWASGQASGKEAETDKQKGITLSRRKVFLMALILALAALLVVQLAGSAASLDLIQSGTSTTSGAGTTNGVGTTSTATSEDAPAAGQSPSRESWPVTSPYAHQPISIGGGAGSMNLRE